MNAPAQSAYERARQAEAAGQHELALSLYLQARRPGDAGRAAYRMGRLAEAARHYLDAAMPLDAAACFHRGGDAARCLDALKRVSRDHPSYRRACQLAIRVACEADMLDLGLDNFLARYLSSPPGDEKDVDAFVRIAALYERRSMPESAAEVLSRVVEACPQHPDAARRLRRLTRAAKPAPIDATIASQDLAFLAVTPRRTPSSPRVALPDLPDLPDLPPAPATQVHPAPVAQTSHTRSGVVASVAASVEPDARALPAGAVIAGRYRVERKLGEGGMASVYAAHDNELDEAVAIKTFQSDDPQFVARFKQEVALSRRLAHPNVVRLYDFGAQGRTKFLTMELLEGESLDARMGRPHDVATGVTLLLHACAGLGAAHAAGIVHRDIKPANFFLTRAGALKLMDFGIAKRPSGGGGLTAAGFIAGTPHYMAPEQIASFSSAGAASDLYALGCMAFELFCGAVPFENDDLMALLMMHLHEPAPSLRARAPHVPASLDALVASLMAKDPARRPQGSDELARRLQGVLGEIA